MGKLGPRLSSRKKAKRWPKGQSSSSNPQTKKHREQASWMFFKDSTGINLQISIIRIFYDFVFVFDIILNFVILLASAKPGISKEDLKKHNAIQGIEPQVETPDSEDNSWETCTENTADTFATNYSNCSNISFSRLVHDCT